MLWNWLKPKRKFIVKPVNGLGNRMRTIVSCDVVARTMNRELLVYWAPSDGFSNDGFYDLFSNKIKLISKEEFKDLTKDSFRLHEYIWKESTDTRYRSKDGFSIQELLVRHKQYPSIYYEGADEMRWMMPQGFEKILHSYCKRFHKKLRVFQPAPALKQKIDAVSSRFGSRTVGIHIRRGDAFLEENPISHLYQISTDKAFMAEMDRQLYIDPETTFFLATDSEEMQERFVQLYRGRLFYHEKEFVGSPHLEEKGGQKDAAIEFFLLGKTCEIIGTNYSTFCELAARWGNIRIRFAREPQIQRTLER